MEDLTTKLEKHINNPILIKYVNEAGLVPLIATSAGIMVPQDDANRLLQTLNKAIVELCEAKDEIKELHAFLDAEGYDFFVKRDKAEGSDG